MMFCFTHTRGTDYEPGDTFPNLRKLLSDHKIELMLKKNETYFCFDNEPFRYLACIQNGIKYQKQMKIDACVQSWEVSASITKRMITQIMNLDPHNTKETVTVNGMRHDVVNASKLLAESLQVLDDNKQMIKRVKKHLEEVKVDQADLEEIIHFIGYELKMEGCEPMTTCSHRDCVHLAKSESGQDTVYRICHSNCDIPPQPPIRDASTDRLNECKVFKSKRKIKNFNLSFRYFRGTNPLKFCNVCSHDFEYHSHRVYKIKVEQKEHLNVEDQESIKSKQTLREKIQEFERRGLCKHFYNEFES